MSLLEEYIAQNGTDGLNQSVINQSKNARNNKQSYTTAQKSGGTTLLEEYIAQNGSAGLNLSTVENAVQPKLSVSQVKTDSKKGKATSTPGKIRALGAGDYGANSDTRTDNIIRAGGYLTASGLAKLGSLLAGGTGELTMGQSAMAAVKGESQQKLEAKKKAKQGKSAKVKLDKAANELYDTAMPSYEKATAPLSENNPIVKLTKAMGNGELSMGENIRAYQNGVSLEEAEAEKAKRQQTDVSGKLGKLAGELGINAVQMAMDAVTGPAALLTMGGRATGSRALELEKLGKSETEQLIGGLTSGMIEVLTEKIGGPFEKIYGKTALSKLTSKFVNSLSKSPAGRAAAKIMADFVSEGVEEVLSDILNPIADKLTGISEADWDWDEMYGDDWTEQWAYDFLVGGILGMTGSGANLITESISTNSQKSAIADKIIENSNEDALINTALETGGKAAELVEEYTKSKNARMLSDIYDAVQEITLSDAVNSRLQELGEKNTKDVAEGIVSYILGKSETAPEGKLAQRAQTELIDAFNGNLQSTNGWALDAIDDMADFSRGILEESGVTKTEETPAEEAPVNENAPAELEYREGSTPTWDADNIVESMFPEEVKDGILTKQDIDSAQSMYDNSGRQNLDEVQSMLEDYIKQVKEERQNGRNNDMDGSMGRQSRESSGVESGKVQSRAEGDKGTDGVGEYRADAGRESLRREAESGTESKVSPKEIGISEGSDEKSLSVIPKSNWNATEKAVVKAFGKASNGFTIVDKLITRADGKKVSGVKTNDGKVVVSRGSRLYKSEQLMIHEGGHLYLDDDIQLVDKLRNAAIEDMSEAEIDELTAAYALKWKGLYGDEEAFDRAANGELDTQELEEFNRKYVTEMLCDALAGIDRAGTKGTSAFSNAVREAFKEETGIDIDALLSGTETEAETETKAPKAKTETEKPRNNGPPERYSYAGERAETADRLSLDNAKQMLEDNVDPEIVRQQTGWFKGMDGQWRFEIDDSEMKVSLDGFFTNPDVIRYNELEKKFINGDITEDEAKELKKLDAALKGVRKRPFVLGDYVQHDALFEAYPELEDYLVDFRKMDAQGAFNPLFTAILLNENLKSNKSQLKKTLIHEMQHAIQAIEGFETGTNLDNATFEKYWNTAGEIEARDASERSELTTEERKSTRPDIDRADVVFAGHEGFSMAFDDNSPKDTESKFVIQQVLENVNNISDAKVFTLHSDNAFEKYKKKSEYVLDIFKEQGGVANNDVLGPVELSNHGAKSTVVGHGYGPLKMAAVSGIKSVIEKGDIIYFIENYDGSGVDRYIIAAKGTIDGEDTYIGAIIKSYPNQKHNGKFYLHEAVIIKETDSSSKTAPQLSVDTVNESASNSSIYTEGEKVNSYSVEDEAPEMMSAEEVQRKKHFKQTVNSESLTKLNERMARLDGAINGYERTENRSEKMERELAEMKADRAVVEKALKAKKAKAELEKRARKNAKAEAEAALGNLSVRRTTAQSRKAAKQQIYEQFGIESGRAYAGNSIDAFLDKWIKQGKIGSKDIDALEASLMEMGAFKIESANDFAQEVRSRMYNGQISVPESVMREFGDNWDAIRQRAFAARIYLSVDSNHAGIDQWTKDLANSFGIGQFDESLDLAAQLENIIDIAEEGKAENMSVYELAERTRRLEGPDVADAYLEEMHDKLMQTLKSFSQSAKIEMDIVKKNAYAQIRGDALRKEKAERAAQERAQREFQQKTLKQLQWLKRNQNFMGTDFQEEAKRILADIDTIAVSAANEMNWSDKYNATWEDLAKMYAWAKENDSNFLPSADLAAIVARVNGKHLDELNASDLENIYKAAVALRTAYYNRNNIIGDELHGTFAEAYEDAVADMRNGVLLDKTTGKFRGFVDSQLNPINRIQRMFGWKEDSAGFEIFGRGLERGERQTKRYVEQANQILDEWLENNKEWVAKADGQGKDAIWYELEVPELLELKMGDKPIFGETVKVYMTPMQKIHMYLESKNYDNLRHMVGGRTFVDKELYSKGEMKEAFAKGTTISLAPETVKKLVSDLTPTEMELATILDRQYYNGYARTEINRVSNILYGYDRAMSDNYAPIRTDDSYNKSEPGVYQDGTAEGVGHMKTRIQGAKNPTYNVSALEAFRKHVSDTSRFVGMAIPMQNAKTLLNWQGRGTTMQKEIKRNWSQKEFDSLENVMTELQAPTYLEQNEFRTFLGNLMSNYIGGTFASNITVAAKVLASEPTAAIVLGGEYYPSVSQKRAVDTNLISKYTSELDVRIRGYGTPELAAMTLSTSKYMQWVQSHKATKLFLGGGLLQAADIYVTKTMWPWAENKVREEYPELEVGTQEQIDNGTSPFYKKVAEVYEDAIGYTQSMYDIMHRSDIMRSKSDIVRSFTIFHTDSLQAMNLIRKRAGELDAAKEQEYNAKSDAEKTAAKIKVNTAAKKFASCVGNVILMNVIVTMFDIIRDLFRKREDKYEDDEGNLTFWSFVNHATGQLVNNEAGLFIGVELFVDPLIAQLTGEQYYAHELIEIDTINDITELTTKTVKEFVGFFEGLSDVMNNDGDVWQYVREDADFRGIVKKAAGKFLHYFKGLPVENVERLITNTIGWFFPQVEAAYDGIWSTGSKKALAESNSLETDIKGLYNGRADISDETVSELARLYETGYKNAIMSDTPTSLSYDGEEYKLSAAQQQNYDETVKWYLHPLDEMMQSTEYLSADDETKAKMLNRFYDYAKDMAKAKVIEGYEVKDFTANVPEWRDQGISWGRIMSGDTTNKKQFAKYVEAGVNEQDAAEIFDTVEALEPEFGHDKVTAQQKVMAISYLPISESSKQAAMKIVYGNSKAAYDRYMISCNHGVASADYADFLNILEGIDKNGGDPSRAEFTEAINRSRIDEDTARDLWYNGYGWKKTSPWG